MENKNIIIIKKMIKYAEEVLSFASNISFDEFKDNRMVIAACVFNISQIGELVKVIDKNIVEKYTNIKWIAIRNIRHRIVHDYDGIQLELIWEVISADLAQLITDLNEIIKKERY